MTVLVDTCIWSAAFRRKHHKDQTLPEEILVLKRLIQQHRAVMIGAILQEVLTGIREVQQFDRLKEQVSAFELLPLEQMHYLQAAQLSNICRSKGVQGSHTDLLICAAAIHYQIPVLTVDNDFLHYAKHLPLSLLHVKA